MDREFVRVEGSAGVMHVDPSEVVLVRKEPDKQRFWFLLRGGLQYDCYEASYQRLCGALGISTPA